MTCFKVCYILLFMFLACGSGEVFLKIRKVLLQAPDYEVRKELSEGTLYLRI